MCKLFVWFSLFSLHLLYHKSTYMSSGALLLGVVRRHYYTYKNVMPLFYNERISQKALRDDASIEMLALISDTRCLDIGRLYGWSSTLYQIISNATEKQKKTVASDLASNLDKIEASIEKIVDAINSAQ